MKKFSIVCDHSIFGRAARRVDRRAVRLVVCLLLCLSLTIGFLPARAEAASSSQTVSLTFDVNFIQSDARAMGDMINEWRLSEPWYWKDYNSTTKAYAKGLEALTYDYRLEKAAMQRAAEMAMYFAHYRPNGDYFVTAPEEQGITQNLWENGAWGYTSAETCFIGLTEEEDSYGGQGHRRTMLNSSINAMAIGHVRYNGIDFWAQEFAYIPEDELVTTPTSVSTGKTSVTMEVVEGNFSISSLSMPSSAVTIGIGKNYKPAEANISGSMSYSFTGTAALSWTSSNTAVLKSNSNGTFTGLKPGTAVLTASLGGYSLSITVTVDNYFVISGNVTTTAGNTAKFSVNGNSNIETYSWQVSKNGGTSWKTVSPTGYPSAATAALSFAAKDSMDGYRYRCKVTFKDGSVYYSKVATLTVQPNPITAQPLNKTVAAGSTVSFKVTASGSVKSYRWQVSKDGGSSWSNVNATKYPSATTSQLSFSAPVAVDGYRYRCRVIMTNGTSFYSDAAKLTVVVNEITQQPVGVTVPVGTEVSFSVAASGSVKSYRWQVSKDDGATWKNVSATTYPSAITPTLTFTTKDVVNGYRYRCVVTFTDNSTITSGIAKLILAMIMVQPRDTTVTAGEDAMFSVAANGGVKSCRWQVSKDGGETWKNVNATTYPSATTPSLTFTTRAELNGYLYRCMIYFTAGGSVVSNAAVLTVVE